MNKTNIHLSEYGEEPNNFHVVKRGDELTVELTYPPRNPETTVTEQSQCRYIIVDQESVRASDGIRIHYDYDRDGYVIEQSSASCWHEPEGKQWEDMTEQEIDAQCNPDWKEVAFIKAWQRQKVCPVCKALSR